MKCTFGALASISHLLWVQRERSVWVDLTAESITHMVIETLRRPQAANSACHQDRVTLSPIVRPRFASQHLALRCREQVKELILALVSMVFTTSELVTDEQKKNGRGVQG